MLFFEATEWESSGRVAPGLRPIEARLGRLLATKTRLLWRLLIAKWLAFRPRASVSLLSVNLERGNEGKDTVAHSIRTIPGCDGQRETRAIVCPAPRHAPPSGEPRHGYVGSIRDFRCRIGKGSSLHLTAPERFGTHEADCFGFSNKCKRHVIVCIAGSTLSTRGCAASA